MSRLDLVIFGATGFTGQRTVVHMVEFAKKYQIASWGVAGRSQKKLDDLMKEVAQKTGTFQYLLYFYYRAMLLKLPISILAISVT